ncbi:Hypothetical Protein FCC1311_009052 [Hondaea fermentalgiana]|uniref:PH domain-containing protein n=1 Tax=Hondaea fermentalgiana TaxID=2315210 RepID=A0A2R5G0Z3_9STRA|nr:Hypothetical Protein FCC1311_009052 [Hondaea fermentalgiana]|eukprot:GBG24687.1 Hypothetical Protein FCC1311_009052 [Hondaea fermentalgiana]
METASEELRKSTDAARSTVAQLARRLSVCGGGGGGSSEDDLHVLAEKLEDQVASWLERCDKDAHALGEERARLRKDRKDLDELKEALHEGMERLAEGRQEMTQIQAKFAKARDEIAHERRRLAEDWAKLALEQQRAATAKTANAEASSRDEAAARSTTATVSNLTAENERLLAKIQDAARERENLQQQLDLAKRELQPVQDTAGKLRDELDTTKHELKAALAKASEWHEKHDNLAAQFATLSGENEALRIETSRLEAARASRDTEYEALRKERDDLKLQLKSLAAASAAAAVEADAAKSRAPQDVHNAAQAILAQSTQAAQPKGEASGGVLRSAHTSSSSNSSSNSSSENPSDSAADKTSGPTGDQKNRDQNNNGAAAAAAAAAAVNEEMVFLQVENQLLIDQNTALRRQVQMVQADLARMTETEPASPTSGKKLFLHQQESSSDVSSISRTSSFSRKTGYVMMADGFTITNDIRWVRQYLVVTGSSFALFPSKRVSETCLDDDPGRWTAPTGFVALLTSDIHTTATRASISTAQDGAVGDECHDETDKTEESKKAAARMHLLVGPDRAVQKHVNAKRRIFDRRSPPFLFRAGESDLVEWCNAINDAIAAA